MENLKDEKEVDIRVTFPCVFRLDTFMFVHGLPSGFAPSASLTCFWRVVLLAECVTTGRSSVVVLVARNHLLLHLARDRLFRRKLSFLDGCYIASSDEPAFLGLQWKEELAGPFCRTRSCIKFAFHYWMLSASVFLFFGSGYFGNSGRDAPKRCRRIISSLTSTSTLHRTFVVCQYEQATLKSQPL